MMDLRELENNQYEKLRYLKATGKKIIGYFCCYTPREMLTAYGLIPFRIMGDPSESSTEADLYVDPVVCPYARSCYDVTKKGRYDFLDGIFFPCPCDNLINIQQVWNYSLEPRFFYSLNVPSIGDELALKFFYGELQLLKNRLEEFQKIRISEEKIFDSIRIHNRNRRFLKDLYELRKITPPLLKGSEVMQILRSVMTMPIEEGNDLLKGFIPEIKNKLRGDKRTKDDGRPRLFILGNGLDNPELIKLIEESGADVVIDDLCFGTRFFAEEINETGDPIMEIARHYLFNIKCSHTYCGKPDTSRMNYFEENFGHLKKWTEEFKATAAVIYVMKYCDSIEWRVPDMREYFQNMGLPVFVLEDDYANASLAPLKTRIQAFIETIV